MSNLASIRPIVRRQDVSTTRVERVASWSCSLHAAMQEAGPYMKERLFRLAPRSWDCSRTSTKRGVDEARTHEAVCPLLLSFFFRRIRCPVACVP
jgi:hypothetical protein